MADYNIDVGSLPLDIRSKLAELELELSEGDITQKGYEKKRMRLLGPYAKGQRSSAKHGPGAAQPSPSTAAQRKAQRRLTREDNRYHSEIRTEAVMQALALHGKKQSAMPMPSKRTSAVYGKRRDTTTDSSSDDDSVFGDDQSRRQNRHRHGTPDSRSGNTPPSASSRQHNVYANVDIPGQSARTALADVMNQSRDSRPSSQVLPGSALADVMQMAMEPTQHAPQPPDVTSNINIAPMGNHRHAQQQHAHAQSVRVSGGAITGMDFGDGGPRHGKVSAKIQQLLNTLKRPKKKKVPTATLR